MHAASHGERRGAPSYAGLRYDARAKHGHVESYFLKANEPNGERALWLRATIYASDKDPRAAIAETWAIAFSRERGHVAVKSQVPFAAARFAKDDYDIRIDGATFTRTPRGKTHGEVSTGDRTITWDLAFDANAVPFVHFPARWMYDGPFPSSKLVTLVPDTRATGTVLVSGEPWRIEAWPAMVGHNWGRRNAARYAWGHCNAWDEARAQGDFVLEGFSAQVALGPALSPATTILGVRHRGVRYESGGVLALLRARGHSSFRRWTFSGESSLFKVRGELWGETDDFVGLHYQNPDGPMTYCLNTKLAHAEVAFTAKGRSEVVYHSRAAALEIGTHDPHHGVAMVL